VTGSDTTSNAASDGGPTTIRVFLLDDHEVVRRGLHELLTLEEDLDVVGEAGTAAQALARIPAVRPDVAVLDVRLPDGSGVEVCREIRSQLPEVRCLMLTSYADDEALFDAIMAGAAGYVLKDIRGDNVVLEVVDDGVGISDGGRRSGLRNLAVRATGANGRCSTWPANPDGTGTRLTFEARIR
jgi:CheY-like chemotaxis protein